MAIETGDLLVLQKNGGGELRKATVSALLATIPDAGTPTLDAVTTAGNNSTSNILLGQPADTKISLDATDGDIIADGSITGNIVAATTAITAGTTIAATESVTAGTEVIVGPVGGTQILLDGATGELGGGSAVFIDGGATSLGGNEVDYA